ncbi:hypothetical protein A2209_04655 [Candidatus Roizmanbacteria bacterium RIFOXYA1_FULL_41_12]|uniref:Uncharacterized protein n=1 Tax=Candidatus Roizmanbacteria bacterium RIFOXYA1_FULL_41_12 TaxID=1802082 RepID=A0A1F7KAQ0_9BACT|nr:MAG: hypothetical protein A2209_04655 [Candidatus Roizmanbacteria bacterium RIFOXYA1_FULL_41_12]OGK66785.1 MAG: hypothetical protein A2377_02670 [Candidatus Roizmanbacteria bacterium RIFOXYB1_FULL_41_27]OGK70840.1 MAG: hypothetical protein A2403_02035 [Candidatus Roizmanbacteria bacterium RIFOXYC1_FULL_41_16]OGK75580.1 MAG: hypothetical protein A2575_02665 [Candidatus Roizmanbacteria bacterium RIFOXYD1_FULL_41_24]
MSEVSVVESPIIQEDVRNAQSESPKPASHQALAKTIISQELITKQYDRYQPDQEIYFKQQEDFLARSFGDSSEAMFFRFAPQALRNLDLPEGYLPKDQTPVSRINTLSLGLLYGLRDQKNLVLRVNNQTYQGTLSKLLINHQEQPELAQALVAEAAKQLALVQKQATIQLARLSEDDFNDQEAKGFRLYLSRSGLISSEKAKQLKSFDLERLFQEYCKAEPAVIENYYLWDYSRDQFNLGCGVAQALLEFDHQYGQLPLTTTSDYWQNQLSTRLADNLNLDQTLTKKDELKQLRRLFQTKDASGHNQLEPGFAQHILGYQEQLFGQPLDKVSLGFLYSLREELGLSNYHLPLVSGEQADLVALKQKLGHLQPILQQVQSAARQTLQSELTQHLGSYRSSILQLLDQGRFPIELQKRYQKLQHGEVNKIDDFLMWLVAQQGDLLYQHLVSDNKSPLSGFAYGCYAAKQYRELFLEKQALIEKSQEELAETMADEDLVLTEALGHTEALRQETRERALLALKQTSFWHRALIKGKKIPRGLKQWLFTPEGETLGRLRVPGKNLKEKALASLKYALPGVITAGLLGLANYSSEGTLNHEVLRNMLPLINGGLIAGAWFLGKEASDLKWYQKPLVFKHLNYPIIAKGLLRGTIGAGLVAGTNLAMNQIGLGQNLDSPTLIGGLTVAKLLSDQVLASLGIKATGTESLINQAFFNKTVVNQAAEIVHLDPEDLPLVTKRNLLETRSRRAGKLAQRTQENRERLQALARFKGHCQLLTTGQVSDFYQGQFGLSELETVADLLSQTKLEMMLLLAHNEARYGARIIHDSDRKIRLDNRQILREIDVLREQLSDYACHHYSPEECQGLQQILAISSGFVHGQTTEKTFRQRLKERKLIYNALTGTTSTLLVGATRTIPVLHHLAETVGKGLSGEWGVDYQPQEVINGVARDFTESQLFEFDPTDQEAINNEISAKISHLHTLNVQLQSRGLLSGTQLDNVWQEATLDNYRLTPESFLNFENQLRASNLSIEELCYFTNLLLRTGNEDQLKVIAQNANGKTTADLSMTIAFFMGRDNNPRTWLTETIEATNLGALLQVTRPELASKLGISISFEDQVSYLKVPKAIREQILNNEEPIIWTGWLNNRILAIKGQDSALVAEFMEGVKYQDRQWSEGLIRQMQGLMQGEDQDLQIALGNPYYVDFLAQTNPELGSQTTLIWKKLEQLEFDGKADLRVLYDRAILGDVAAFNSIYHFVETHFSGQVESIFVSENPAKNQQLYEAILLAANQTGAPVKQSLQNALVHHSTQLGFQPVGMEIESATYFSPEFELNLNGSVNDTLVNVLDGRLHLETAMLAQAQLPPIIFTRNGVYEGAYQPLQSNVTDFPLAQEWLSIEQAPQDNQAWHFMSRFIGRNLKYKLMEISGGRLFPGAKISGSSDYAMSMIDWLGGGPGQFTIGREPSFLHRPDQYSPEYLLKLFGSVWSGHIPKNLEASFNIEQVRPVLDQADQEKYQTLLGQLCWKLETYLAGQRLGQLYTADELAQIYARWVPGGHINGLEIRGWDMMAQVYLGQHYNELTLPQQHLIFVISQAGDRWSPATLVQEDFLLFQEQSGVKLDFNNITEEQRNAIFRFKIETLVERAKDQLMVSEKFGPIQTSNPELWHQWMAELDGIARQPDKYFLNKVPPGYYDPNIFEDPEINQFFGLNGSNQALILNDAILEEAKKNGRVSWSADGILMIELPTILKHSEKVLPHELFQPYELTTAQNTSLWVQGHYAAMFSSQLQDHNPAVPFTFEAKGFTGLTPTWVTETNGETIVNPGIATIITDGSGEVLTSTDLTGVIAAGPQEFGSAVKPLMVFVLSVLEPERYSIEANQPIPNTPFEINGMTLNNDGNPWNLSNTTPTQTLAQAIVNSQNRPIVAAMREYLERHPEDGYANVQRVLAELGLKIYFEGDLKQLDNQVPHLFEIGLVPLGSVEGADKSGAEAFARAYSMIANPEAFFAAKPDYIKQADLIFGTLADDDNRDNPVSASIWGGIRPLMSGQCGIDEQAVCASKTGTADLGALGVKNTVDVYMMHLPNGQVRVLLTVNSGYDGQKQIGLEQWGMQGSLTALPANVRIGHGLGQIETTSPAVALNSLDLIFNGQSPITNYSMAKIPATFIRRTLKEVTGFDPQEILGLEKYYYVDLIGESENGVQNVSIAFNTDEGMRIATLAVPQELVETITPGSTEFYSQKTWDQLFVDLLPNLVESQPTLERLKAHGFRFVLVGEQNNSPFLQTIYHHMKQNGHLFAGSEEFGLAMKQLGFDPSHTVFVNEELAGLYFTEDNVPNLLYYLQHQQGYSAIERIVSSANLDLNMDQLMFVNNQSSSQRRLLDIFLDTMFFQGNLPLPKERTALVHRFLAIIDSPNALTAAPDLVRAYQAFKVLYGQSTNIVPGSTSLPDPTMSQEFLQSLLRIEKTTWPELMQKLELVQSQIPSQVPPMAFSAVPVVIEPDMVEVTAAVTETSFDGINIDQVIKQIITQPSSESLVEENTEQVLSRRLVVIADALDYAYQQSIQIKGLSESAKEELLRDIFAKKLHEGGLGLEGIKMTSWLDSLFSSQGHFDCVDSVMSFPSLVGSLGLDFQYDHSGLASTGISEFGANSQTIGNAAGFMGGIKFALGEQGTVSDFFKTWLDKPEVNDFKPGDLFVSKSPQFDSTGHIGIVLHRGVTAGGQEYMLIFDSNVTGKGETRIIAVTNDNLVSLLSGLSDEQYNNYLQKNITLPYIGLIRQTNQSEAAEITNR